MERISGSQDDFVLFGNQGTIGDCPGGLLIPRFRSLDEIAVAQFQVMILMNKKG